MSVSDEELERCLTTDYEAEYKDLVERLWDRFSGDSSGPNDAYNRGRRDVEYAVRSMLPPRPPKIVEGLTMQEAFEGLRDGRFRRAQPAAYDSWEHHASFWARKNTFEYEGALDGLHVTCILGTWRAELA